MREEPEIVPARHNSIVGRFRPCVTAIAVVVLSAIGRGQDPGADGPIPSILISRQLAAARHLSVGDVVNLSGQPTGANGRRFLVTGVYEPTADPMRLAARRLEARLHLPDLLALTADPSDPAASESVTSINVVLADPADVDGFARELSAQIPIPGLTARPTQGGDDSATVFVVLDRFHLAIAVVTVVASTVFLLALMVMLVEERRESMGILRLIGLRRARLLLQVFAEGLLIAAAGVPFGIVLAALSRAPSIDFSSGAMTRHWSSSALRRGSPCGAP